ncbi:hypothetical protein [Rhodococcus sp. USK10]|uniref:hypothetical protein n=1 Tax=Rhodococcus sp. USK10 TaxID=2789739 RepID=UPI0021509634|nr:hypothetical protein [Rhodococcus sp. USK10]
MARRRGFFAEMQHQARLAEQRQRQQQRATAQAHARAVREAQRAQREFERAQAASARMAASDAAHAAKERARLHEQARLAEVERLNTELAEQSEAIDSLLSATLSVDDYVDLAALRQQIAHPPFDRPDLTTPTRRPDPLPYPPEPVYTEPPAPTGLGAALGGKKKHASAISDAQALFWQQHHHWQGLLADRTRVETENEHTYARIEAERAQKLQAAQEQYERECRERRESVLSANVKLERLMVALQEREPWALEEYVSIVLGNSVYPDCFPVEHDFAFDPADRELRLTVTVPAPAALPAEKAFKYVKASDSITSTPLTVKARKDRYAKAVSEVAIRTVHEIFEADRDGIIATISMELGTRAIDPGTGHDTTLTLVQLATDRDTFTRLDLSRVEARATLDHLRAGVSKNPHDLVPVANTRGVRG